MALTSPYLVLILLAAILVYYLLNPKYRIAFLVLLSCAFIASYSSLLLPYVIIYSAVNYYIGKRIPLVKNKVSLYRSGVAFNLLQLLLLRYSSFAIDPVFQLFRSSIEMSWLQEALMPVGISYFTLQGIGYLINIKMGWEKPEGNFLNFLLYIIFFPKFLSGPIERSNHFFPQVKQVRTFDSQELTAGLKLALIGFIKKLAIANELSGYVDIGYQNLDAPGGISFWILFIIQPLYLYFDFSGYTDIAIGMARAFGINLLPNFNSPFLSENVTTFWKRFHMSLSSWFHDYIFRQVSFRRRKWGIYASTYAVFITFFLFGIWHGAGWNFMIVGLLQVLAINYEFFTKTARIKISTLIPKYLYRWLSRLFTFLFYCLSLVFFFSPDVASALIYLSKLTSLRGNLDIFGPLSLSPVQVIFYMMIFFCLEILKNDNKNVYERLLLHWSDDNLKSRMFRWSVYSFAITILIVVGNRDGQFIYINF